MRPLDPDELGVEGGCSACVVLATATDAEAAVLRDRLRGRGVRTALAPSPIEAMVELCMLEREQRARAAWGLARAGALALVVGDRAEWSDLSGLFDAVRGALGDTAIWVVDEGVALQVHPSTASTLRLSDEESTQGPPRGSAPRSLRLTAPEDPPRASPVLQPGPRPERDVLSAGPARSPAEREPAIVEDDSNDAPDATVSAEELAMLLREQRLEREP